MSIRTLMLSVTALAAAGALSPRTAAADTPFENLSVVHDTSGDIVRTGINGLCVRINQPVGYNECAPAPAPMAQAAPPPPPPQPRTVIVPPQPPRLTEAERSVYFAFDKADLTPQSQARLDHVAETLKASTEVESATIVGYADRIGDFQYNIDLSRRRAEAVKSYLDGKGYTNARVAEAMRIVDTRAKGESQPTTSCDQSLPWDQLVACLQPDRRVDIDITYRQ